MNLFKLKFLLVGLLSLGFVTACDETGDRKSRQGESCSYNNECESGLSCIMNMCVRSEFPVDYTGKVCIIIECLRDRDCGNGLVCNDSRCETEFATCDADQGCETNEICSRGRCIECVVDEDCNNDEVCVAGLCEEACRSDLECGLFQSCNSGRCENTGCRNDRQCILFIGDPAAVCSEGSCKKPCGSDSECSGLQTCNEGTCTFIGCADSRDCIACLNSNGPCQSELRGAGAGATSGSVECVPREELSGED